MTEQRYLKAEMAAWIGVAGNALLALMKGTIGYSAQSKVLMADAAHSASNVIGSAAVLVGLRSAQLSPDYDHADSQGMAESITATIVSVLLLVVGVEIGFHSAKAIYDGVDAPPAWYAIIAIVVSIIVKEFMFQYKSRLERKRSSRAHFANPGEHRSDVFSSLAALIGVGGALLGAWQEWPWLYYLDPLAGLFVAFLVLRMGYSLVKQSVQNKMERGILNEDAEKLLNAVQNIKGVITVDELSTKEQGHYVIVDVTVCVNPKITVLEGHDIAKVVRHHLMQRFIYVSDVCVHVHPYDPGYPYKNNVDSEFDSYSALLH